MSERSILEKLIQDGKDAEKKLKALEVTYSIGDRFRDNLRDNGKCILIRATKNNEVVMAGLKDGNYYHTKPVKVKNDTRVTQKELDGICSDCDFTRYWDNRKKVKV